MHRTLHGDRTSRCTTVWTCKGDGEAGACSAGVHTRVMDSRLESRHKKLQLGHACEGSGINHAMLHQNTILNSFSCTAVRESRSRSARRSILQLLKIWPAKLQIPAEAG
jgi:hypothetical protein